MKISIIYFSGTGNTRSVAKAYKSAFERLGHYLSLASIEETDVLIDHDLLVIGAPIYAGNMPSKLIHWVKKKIPSLTNIKDAIVYSTSAGLKNAHGVNSIGKKLSHKGYKIIDLSTYEMPRNFYFKNYNPTPESIKKKEFQEAQSKIKDSIASLAMKKSITSETSIYTIDLMAKVFRLMARFMGKNYTITDQCIACGLCEEKCPEKNISYKDQKFHNRCILCTRCIHNCPVKAITYKGKVIEPYRINDDILVK